MKYILKVKIPNTHGNELMKDPQFGMKMQKILEEVKAENAYFTTLDGQRAAYIIVNINDVSQIPMVGEPFFNWLKGDVDFLPVMTPTDLQNASNYIQDSVKKWGN